MDKLADLGQGFMGLTETGEKVAYFSFGNLKGGITSIAIGALFYVIVARLWMMKKQEDGSSIYLNRWPRLIDLEDYFYRPVLLVILPAICGGICGILDKLTDTLAKSLLKAGTVAAGLLDTVTDAFVVLLRKTVYRDYTKMGELKEGNELTHLLGGIANIVNRILNRTFRRNRPKEANYKHKLALGYSGLRETFFMITRSLSYGLILFCIGLCITLIYLLVGAVK